MDSSVANAFVQGLLNSLTYDAASQEKLVELAWEQLTPEEKRAFALLIRDAAAVRIEKVVESRVWSGGGLRSLFGTHIRNVVLDYLQTEPIKTRVRGAAESLVNEELEKIREHAEESLNRLREAINEKIRQVRL